MSTRPTCICIDDVIVLFGKCSTHVRCDENCGIQVKTERKCKEEKKKNTTNLTHVFLFALCMSISVPNLSLNMLKAKGLSIHMKYDETNFKGKQRLTEYLVVLLVANS